MDSDISMGGALLHNTKKGTVITAVLYVSIVILLCYLIFLFFVALTPIDGTSMENTLSNNQLCLVQRNGYRVSRGDIVTLNTAASDEDPHIIIKRVIGTAGDRLLFMRSQDGKQIDLYICKSGERRFALADEPYIKAPMSPYIDYGNAAVVKYIPDLQSIDIFAEDTDEETTETIELLQASATEVPKKSIFFMGDNRNGSRDSRFYGTREVKHTTGKVISILEKGGGAEKFFRILFFKYGASL